MAPSQGLVPAPGTLNYGWTAMRESTMHKVLPRLKSLAWEGAVPTQTLLDVITTMYTDVLVHSKCPNCGKLVSLGRERKSTTGTRCI